jgi:hypothetical protein
MCIMQIKSLFSLRLSIVKIWYHTYVLHHWILVSDLIWLVHIFCRLNVFSEESVPLFGPPLPTPSGFSNYHEFRDFLLVKCKFIYLTRLLLLLKQNLFFIQSNFNQIFNCSPFSDIYRKKMELNSTREVTLRVTKKKWTTIKYLFLILRWRPSLAI